MRICRLVVFGFAFGWSVIVGVSAGVAPPKWAHELSDIPVSPRVTFGRLENGMRYALVPNHTPPGQVSVRLLVLAGSLNEGDGELGYAHFVEHMAFRGTRNFPADEKVKFLQSLGVAFGPHVNAETTAQHTLYKLDFPENSEKTIASALRITRDWTDGLLFDPAEVDRERGVVLTEAAGMAKPNPQFETLYAGTLITRRPPIGTDASIKKAKATGLRAFYDAWYRPENMIVVVAGDFDPANLEPLLKKEFEAIRARAEVRTRPSIGTLTEAAKPLAKFFPEIRNGVQSEMGTIRIEPPPPDTKQSRFNALELETAHRMLRRRMQRLVSAPDPLIVGFMVNDAYPYGAFRQTSITTAGHVYKWPTVLAKGEQELRRALDFGFDVSELREIQESLHRELKQEVAAATTTPTATLAADLAAALEAGRVFTFLDEPATQLFASECFDRLTVDGCRAALRQAWGDSPRYVFITASQQLIKPTSGQIRDKIEETKRAKVTAVVAVEKPQFAYEDFGPPGEVVAKEHIADLDVWQVHFANGVALNLKRNEIERGRVHIGIRVGSGRLAEPKDRPGLTTLAGMAVFFGGLQKQTDDELQRALGGTHISTNISAESDAYTFTSISPSEEVLTAVQILTAFLTDAAFRSKAADRLAGSVGDLYSRLELSADGVMEKNVRSLLSGDDARIGYPPRAVIEKQTMEAIGAWLKPLFQSEPIEVTLVGDFDIDEAIQEIARTLGALPKRKPRTDHSELSKLHFPTPPIEKTFSYRTPDKNRATTLAYYWPVNVPFTYAENARLQLLGLILEERLRVEVRLDKGEAYSPSARFEWNDTYPGLADLYCRVDVTPDHANKTQALVRAIALKLGRSGATADELSRVKAVSVASVQHARDSNDYWFSTLSDSQEHPWRLDNARTLVENFRSATLEEINAYAAKFITEKNTCQFTIKPVYQKR